MKNGQPLTYHMLRNRFDDVRTLAASAQGDSPLAEQIRKFQFQFQDIKAKGASEIDDIDAAQALLGHAGQRITANVYRRAGQKVNPTK